jgi:serine/threonine protein kinase
VSQDVREVKGKVLQWEIDPDQITFDKTQVLGEGANATVYIGELAGTKVAIKCITMSKDLDERLIDKECAVMSALQHPNIISFLGKAKKNGQLLIVTELLPNGSVQNLLENNPTKVTRAQKMKWIFQLVSAISLMHAKGFVHLDLKPDNLLLDANNDLKLADFGLSQLSYRKIRPNGTLGYAAPEILKAVKDFKYRAFISEKADVYSFATIIWVLLWQDFGNLPDTEQTEQGIHPAIPDDCSDHLREVLEKCWKADPDDRPTLRELIDSHLLHEALLDIVFDEPNLSSAREIWKRLTLIKGTTVRLEKVPFMKFFQELRQFTNIPPAELSRLPFMKSLEGLFANKKGLISIENFALMVNCFGPVDDHFMHRIVDAVRQPWFQGKITRADSAIILANAPQDTFLVRFSSIRRGHFSLDKTLKGCTADKPSEVVHIKLRLNPKTWKFEYNAEELESEGKIKFKEAVSEMKPLEEQCSTLREAIQVLKEKYKLEHPILLNKFQPLFAHIAHMQA